ncbi:MAG: SUMF1/EgtB/PvdO family nonheme iron enzyme [Anaerolineales bacterium]|nr:SUMF1/EgtB/PvdO family nonheme iron enzyme [Anaerolineales bacterium]
MILKCRIILLTSPRGKQVPENRPLRVFLCHSSNDKPTVRELYRQLSVEGWLDVWLDEEKLYPGQDWNLEIEKAVESADAILVCLSNNSITKEGYVQRELRIVLDYADYKPEGTLYLIPIRLEDCDPPRRLRPWQYADYFEKDRDRAYQRLLVSLRMRANSLGILAETLQAKPVTEKPMPGSKRESIEPADKYTPGDHTIYSFSGIEFVKVPAGKFLMGNADKDKSTARSEKPQHTVDLPYEYYIGRFPVTNEQYAAYIKAKGTRHPVSGWEKKRDHPVVSVSLKDAMGYCKWLDELLKDKLPAGFVLRLPTEAEWEKAARGEKGLVYPWGDIFDKAKCNTKEGGRGTTTPVGAYSPQGDSPYGCADMSGNVWEWTHSIYKSYPYKGNDEREDINTGGRRIVRGGSFYVDCNCARCTYRGGRPITPLNEDEDRGFRVVASQHLS